MSNLQDHVRSLLRPSEEVRAVLEITEIPDSEVGSSVTQAVDDPRNRRVVAVVAHKENGLSVEEGSVFILKFRPVEGSPNDVSEELEVQRVYPISEDFSVRMSQMNRNTLNLGSDGRPSLQPRAGINVTIAPGRPDARALTLHTQDSAGLRTIIQEYKRLQAASAASQATIQTFSWIAPYTHARATKKISHAIPLDLRTQHAPLDSRLSPASAGMPGDDVSDISTLRDEWLRRESRRASLKGKCRLNIRIGTFNVNGKNPTQDLSTWVRPSSTETKRSTATLPPIEGVSPLSLGEVARNPIEDAGAAGTESLSAPSAPSISGTTVVEEPTSMKEATVPADPDSSETDLLVFGFQELDLSTEALLYSTSTAKEEAWLKAIFAALGEEGDNYEKLASKQLVGMLIIIVVKKRLRPCFGDIKASAVGAGIMGIMGNKGGTAIRVQFTPPFNDAESHDNSYGPVILTFVNAHLAAFDEMVDKRNADFHDLSRRLTFELTPEVVATSPSSSSSGLPASASSSSTGSTTSSAGMPSSSSSSVTVSASRTSVSTSSSKDSNVSQASVSTATSSTTYAVSPAPPQQVGVFESDALFWMGDLNYRIDLSDSDVRTILASKHWTNRLETLYKYDQLRTAISNQRAFEPFAEFPITHVPTYRFSSGVMTDELGYDMKRRPAWCDRILYLDSSAAAVEQYWYSGVPGITFSDHRPVAAAFHVDVDLYEKQAQDRASRHLHRQVHVLDVMDEVHDRAVVVVEGGAVDFGTFGYGQTIQRELTIRNTGKIPCAFRFVPPAPGLPTTPHWIRLSLSAGLLLPEEKITITLTATVDDEAAAELNQDPRRAEETIILHVLCGKDHFITVGGAYEPTCFANSLTRLTRLPGTIRELKSNKDLLSEEEAGHAPKEVARLVNWLMSNATTTPDLFFGPTEAGLVDTIRTCLDTGAPFPEPNPTSPHPTATNSITTNPPPISTTSSPSPHILSRAFASTLLSFLASLTEPVVPYALHARCASVASRDEAFEVLEALPPASVNVWISVTAFLHFISQDGEGGVDEDSGEKAGEVESVGDVGKGEREMISKEARLMRLATLFYPILMPDDPKAAVAVSPVGRCRFLRCFIE
ncbi:DNase I-like protein [Schizophyllum commune Tattone D]|nr:DNase I-like protein [Schizophyllum commune Tattone D]